MNDFIPRYQVGDALLFRYVPFDYINPQTGEAITQTPEIPCTVVSIAHNLSHDLEIGPGTLRPGSGQVWLPRVYSTGWTGFYYYVEIDQEEAALLGLTLTYPSGQPQTAEVIKENQITGERIAF